MSSQTAVAPVPRVRHDLTEFVATSVRTLVRTLPLVVGVLLVPVSAVMWLLGEALGKYVRVRNVITVLDRAQDAPTDAIGGLIVTTSGLAQSLVLISCGLAAYLLLSLPIIMHAGASSALGGARWRVSVASGFMRLHRTVPAFAIMGLLAVIAVLAGPGTLGYLLLDGAASWQEPLSVALLVGAAALGLVAWAGTRLAFLVPAAVSAPSRSFTLGRALRATRGRWWATFTRIVLAGLTCTAVTGVTWSLLIPWLSAGTQAQVTAAILISVGMPLVMGGVFSVLLGVAWALAARDSGAGDPPKRAVAKRPRVAQVRESQTELVRAVSA